MDVGKDVMSRQLLEVRFKPNARIIDRRGELAEGLSTTFELPRWQFTNDRVDVWEEGEGRRLFVSFRNMGTTARNAPTEHFAATLNRKFLKHMFDEHDDLFDSNGVTLERVGVRGVWLVPYGGTLGELAEGITKRLAPVTSEAMAVLGGGKLTDGSVVLNTSSTRGNVNNVISSVVPDQVSSIFPETAQVSPVSLAYDTDSWTVPKGPVSEKELLDFVENASREAWKRSEQVRKLILGA